MFKRICSCLLLLCLLLGFLPPARASGSGFKIDAAFKSGNAVAFMRGITVEVTILGHAADPLFVNYTWLPADKDEVITTYKSELTDTRFFYGLGEGRLDIVVYDANGWIETVSLPFHVYMLIQFEQSSESPMVGKDFNVIVSPSGGVAPYTYTYTWKGSDEATASFVPVTVTTDKRSITHNFDKPGRYALEVIAEDANGVRGEAELVFHVSSFGLEIGLSPLPAVANQPFNIDVKPLGGRPPYRYTIFVYECENNDWLEYPLKHFKQPSGQVSVMFSYGWKGTVDAIVYDADGRMATGLKGFSINGGTSNPIVSTGSALDFLKVYAGQTQTVRAQATGGNPPYKLHVEYTNFEQDGSTKGYFFSGAGLQASFTVPPGTGGTVTRLTIIDKAGRNLKSMPRLIFDTLPKARLAGDATGDGQIRQDDLLQVLRYLNTGTFCDYMLNADADQQDRVDLKDLQFLINKLI